MPSLPGVNHLRAITTFEKAGFTIASGYFTSETPEETILPLLNKNVTLRRELQWLAPIP